MSSSIEWLARPGTKPETWNPVTGCTKVSAGCKHCYAEAVANRFWAKQYRPVDGGVITAIVSGETHHRMRPRVFTDVMCHEDRLALPLKWRTPRTCFVNSMSDLFHEAVPDEFIDRVFATMALCRKHQFIVLTKRPERMRAYLAQPGRRNCVTAPQIAMAITMPGVKFATLVSIESRAWPLPNVWLGVSAEDRPTLLSRGAALCDTPASVRVLSLEPLLEDVVGNLQVVLSTLGPRYPEGEIDWVIVGGESGAQARPCDVAWIRSAVQQCRDAGVPVFVKQLGSNPIETNPALGGVIGQTAYPLDPLHARKGNDPAEWPEDLRVRQWPEVPR